MEVSVAALVLLEDDVAAAVPILVVHESLGALRLLERRDQVRRRAKHRLCVLLHVRVLGLIDIVVGCLVGGTAGLVVREELELVRTPHIVRFRREIFNLQVCLV